jgi:hypothetical protein
LNPRQRANLIVSKFESLEDCVVFEVDGKAFEAHVGPHQLRQEHAVYRAAFPGDRELSDLLRVQERLEGRASFGAKFSREGGRASGDFNTGMGNTIIMLAVVVSCLRAYKVPFDVLVDGDNALVFLRHRDSSRVLRVFAADVLACSGHEVTLERPVSVLEEIRFGQSAPIHLGPKRGYCMVRDYRKVLSGALSSHRWLREPRFAREWIAGVARCELSLARGLPVLQEWALQLLDASEHSGAVRAHPYGDYFYLGGWMAGVDVALDVSLEARVSFERAFGLDPEAQVRLERSFRGRLGRTLRRPYVTWNPGTFDQAWHSFEIRRITQCSA